jgi:gliding motility-associated-like protein
MFGFRVCLVGLLAVIPFISKSQSALLLNEVSQGVSGSQEYVEFVVAGVTGCSGSTTIDVRGVIIDDNNGDFQSGAGAGIAPGAVRFANTPFWQAIPAGTLIVVYNENDRGAAIPPDDASMSDGNGRLILPANSPLLEGQNASPNNGSSAYPASGWTAGGGQWTSLGMANGGDSFQIRASVAATAPSHAVSWGTNTAANIIYFSGSASGQVYFCVDSPIQSGWSSGSAATSQTPGSANNAANAAFIQSFTTGGGSLQVALTTQDESCFNACDGSVTAQVNGGQAPFTYVWSVPAGNVPSITSRCPGSYSVTVTDNNGCSGNGQATIEAATQLQATATQTDETCAGQCDGTASVQITGGAAPYSVSWSNGGTSQQLVSLCPDDYDADITDANGCTTTAQVTVGAGAAIGSPDFVTNGPFGVNDGPVQLENETAGGTYATLDCSDCLTADGIFDPSAAGTYTICYMITANGCSASDCEDFVVENCSPQETHNAMNICEGDSVLVFGQWIDTAGVYTQINTTPEGCTLTNYITLTVGCPGEPVIFVPNVFTPNGDLTNDMFTIELTGGLVDEGFILNRWGEVIKTFDSNDISWDGSNERGQDVPDGVYTYLVRYAAPGGVNSEVHGHVTLIR